MSDVKAVVDRWVNLAQLLTLVVGIFVIAMKVGARDQVLSEHDRAIAANKTEAERLIAESRAETQALQAMVFQLIQNQAKSAEESAGLRRDIERLLTRWGTTP